MHIHFQLEVQTQQFGQLRGSSLTVWNILSQCEMSGKEDTVRLILDKHESQFSNSAITMTKENVISLLTLPPHTSHNLRPLDCNISVHTEYTWCGRKVKCLSTLWTNRQRSCLPLHMAVTLTPAVDSVQIWTCYSCYAIVESVWSEVVFVMYITKMDMQNF